MPLESLNPFPIAQADIERIRRHGVSFWKEMEGARLFITGASGFFGKWWVESLLRMADLDNRDIKLTLLVRDPQKWKTENSSFASDPRVKLVNGDIRDFEFPREEFSHILHFATAASASLNEEEPLLMWDVIVQGTRRVLDFAKICGKPPVLLASSGAIYGSQPALIEKIDENYQGSPNLLDGKAAYGHGKRFAEHLALHYYERFGVPTRVTRCFAFVGPHLPLDRHFAIGNFMGDALAGRTIQVAGNGRPYRSYLYAADLVVWLMGVLIQGKPLTPYNVGSEKAVTIADLATLVGKLRKVDVQIAKPVSDTEGPAPRYVPSTQKAREELGLKETVGLEEAVERTLQWHEKKREAAR